MNDLLRKANLNPKHFDFLEPSAGSGLFIQGLNEKISPKKIYAYDLEPQAPNIIKSEFLETEPQYSKNNIIIWKSAVW